MPETKNTTTQGLKLNLIFIKNLQ
ncbi:hypothetical protein QJS24_gp39 [Serratia phage vB_SmaS_Rovert]|uniref:Uncharacterized protein n=1 Tax=Serratia phage vB_SmaS_Rovert TaxID=2777363 RepID=A0A7T3TKY6_9CAUD|nr:hypothetical protein QJS24_gp39 [Serratia phage vB_SmaS_Rovert]QPX75026.1 hypothetical protein [Serratia phage vB_SmaS_Rovert]